MDFLEEQGIGHAVGPTVVPIVPGAVLFDLGVGDYRVRPKRENGYRACQRANLQVKEGNVGAGMGATVGKLRGYSHCTKGGLGTSSLRLNNGFTVGALVAVNAFGDIADPATGRLIAGVRDNDGSLMGTESAWMKARGEVDLPIGTNTTIAIVACNGEFDKSRITKIAQMAHDGLARVIRPVHTMCDGDTVFALATGEMAMDVSVAGYMAQEALSRAVIRAVYAAASVSGIKCCRE
jgi:L-aminopeptidase/D-esterase-like protein